MACVEYARQPVLLSVFTRTMPFIVMMTMTMSVGAAEGCSATESKPLCVELRESIDPAVARFVTQIVSDRSCTVDATDSSVNGASLVTASVSEKGVAEILSELNRRRMSYAYAVVPGKRRQNACVFKLVPLRSSVVSNSAPLQTKKTTTAPQEKPTPKSLPVMRYDYLSKEDVLPDFQRLRDAFSSLGDSDKQEALGIMSDLYNEWGLSEAQAFIADVAHGSLQYRVPSTVRNEAVRLASSIDAD